MKQKVYVCVCERERESDNTRYTENSKIVLTRIVMTNNYKEDEKVIK